MKRRFWAIALLAGAMCAQPPTFKTSVSLVRVIASVKNKAGELVGTLKADDFEIYEDGVKQDITSMTLSAGGRVTNLLAPPPVLASEGLILPPARVVNDVSGRVFIFFVDDLHLQFHNTGRVRDIFKKISKTLLHDGEFRFEGRPVESLKSLDRAGLVAYVGTFSKTLFPDLRIGYVVPPATLREPLWNAKRMADCHSCMLTQTALGAFCDVLS